MNVAKSELNTLDSMIGKEFMYHARPFKIHGYVCVNGHVEVRTNNNSITIKKENLTKELDNFLPIDADFGALEIKKDAKKLRDLEQKLYNAIDKIEEDDSYIKKAKAMTSTADTIINMEKLKIQMLKEVNR